jgi:hypothetical protein
VFLGIFFFVALQFLKDLDHVTYRRFLELFRLMVGLLGRVFSPSRGLYLHRTTQHRKTGTNIHALSWIRTHDLSNQPAKTHASDRTASVTDVLGYRDNNFSYDIQRCVSNDQVCDNLSGKKIDKKCKHLSNFPEEHCEHSASKYNKEIQTLC